MAGMFSRRKFVAGAAGMATASIAQGQGRRRPNIVVFLADDLGPGDVGCYGGKTPTPNIDRLAREGTRFTRYYAASPICSPSRCGLLTGSSATRAE